MKKFFDPYLLYILATKNIKKNEGIDQTDWIRPTIVAEISRYSARTGKVG